MIEVLIGMLALGGLLGGLGLGLYAIGMLLLFLLRLGHAVLVRQPPSGPTPQARDRRNSRIPGPLPGEGPR